jgi:predicted SnoaL-like aldol condensation-catalyzing enzyme
MRALGLIGTFGVCGAVAAAGGCATTAVLEQELAKTNTQTVLAFEDTVFNKHEVSEAFTHYVGSSFTEHDLRLGGRADTQVSAADDKTAAVHAYGMLLKALAPGSHRVFLRTIAQGNLVATQSHWDGQADGAATVAVVDIYRLNEGRIVEHWDVVQR